MTELLVLSHADVDRLMPPEACIPVMEKGRDGFPGESGQGLDSHHAREVDSPTMAAALFVDRRESTLNEAGDFLFAAKELGLKPDHIRAELGEILIGAKPGRSSPSEITLFKSLGLAAEDLASAEFLLAEAAAKKAGTRVDFR